MRIDDPSVRETFFAIARGEPTRGSRAELRDRGFINYRDEVTPKGLAALMRNGYEGPTPRTGPTMRQIVAQPYRRAGVEL